MRKGDRFWDDWQTKRRKELQKAGVPRQDAKLSAKFERRSREKAAGLVGAEAAIEHSLVVQFSPCGQYRTALSIPKSAVPPQYKSRATAWAGAPHPTWQ